MLCSLNNKFRPDKKLQLWLGLLVLTLMVLAISIVIFMLFPYYKYTWFISAISILSVAIIFAIFAVRDGETAINYGGLAYALAEADSDAKRLDSKKGKPILYNKAGRDFFGTGDIISNLEQKLVDDDIVITDFERIKRAVKSLVPENVEIAIRSSDNIGIFDNKEWYKLSVTPISLRERSLIASVAYNEDKNSYALLWSAENITARKNMEEIIREERADLHDFLDFLPVGLYLADSYGTICYANNRLAEWLGKPREAILRKNLTDIIADKELPIADGAWNGELNMLHDDGSIFRAYISHTTFVEDGETKTRAIVMKDVGHNKELSEAFRKAENRIDWLMKYSPAGIVFIENNGLIMECNEAFAEMIGSKNEEAPIGTDLLEYISSDYRLELQEAIEQVLLHKRSVVNIEIKFSSDGKDRVASVFVTPMNNKFMPENLKLEGLVMHFIDTTRQSDLEQQFAQAQKMQAMGQLAGGVSHDFNNLLTAMIGFCDLLLQRHGQGDPSFADLMQIKSNANRAAGLVRQLLAFSRRQPLKPQLIDISEHFTDLSHMLQRILGEKIVLQYFHGRDLGLIRVDPNQFAQVIMNLAVNAKDAMPQGGYLTIKTKTVKITEENSKDGEVVLPGDYIVIDVSDTGCGIPEDVLPRIFEPFFSTKQNIVGSGTGLGLATVYGIVKQTNGFISVTSEKDKGTTFSIHFPRHEAGSSGVVTNEWDESFKPIEFPSMNQDITTGISLRPEEPSNDKPSHDKKVEPKIKIADSPVGSGKILFVEDEDAVRAFGARALRNKGYEVTECSSGENALETLEKTTDFDMLITDMVMPGIDGASLAEKVKKACPKIKIMLMSGYSDEVARKELAASPEFAFLAKPFDLSELAKKVREVIHS